MIAQLNEHHRGDERVGEDDAEEAQVDDAGHRLVTSDILGMSAERYLITLNSWMQMQSEMYCVAVVHHGLPVVKVAEVAAEDGGSRGGGSSSAPRAPACSQEEEKKRTQSITFHKSAV